MSSHRRIRTIYAKELVDILRDRRTLMAMIVVPIVLYPLLMLGSIQAVSHQTEMVGQEHLVIGVIDEEHGLALRALIDADGAALKREYALLDPESEDALEFPGQLTDAKIHEFGSTSNIEDRVRNRSIHIGVIFDSPTLLDMPEAQNAVCLHADMQDVRSSNAWNRLRDMIDRITKRTNSERKRQRNLPETFDQPFKVSTVDLSAPSSILGQILPLILILMTITGAIYPAIDLTAGERERGTLESLMVCPVPVIDLIVGKFLVVTTVAIMGAALNLGSVAATVYFGGLGDAIAGGGDGLPLGTMAVILLCLIPFAVLMSAIMIAVCSFARTFKEAQNYVTPVILAVLIPGGIAALPATRMEGIMLVMPVGNMVLLTREFLLGAVLPHWQIALVLLSTTLYAGAAVAIAANVFGKESVVFADAGSFKSGLSRRLIKPSQTPIISMGLLVVALLFPAWFYVQSALSPGPGEDAAGLLYATGWLMPLLFVALPLVICAYWKVDIKSTFCVRMPSIRHLVGGVLIGVSAWVPAHELNIFQKAVLGTPQSVIDSAIIMEQTLASLPIASAFLLIAVMPAVCEELLFRGFFLGSLGGSTGKWTAIVVSAAVFGVFHFVLFKFVVTAGMGLLLGYLCWQSRSILPGITAHLLHNSLGVLAVVKPEWFDWIGVSDEAEWNHLPGNVIIVGGMVFAVALLSMRRAK